MILLVAASVSLRFPHPSSLLCCIRHFAFDHPNLCSLVHSCCWTLVSVYVAGDWLPPPLLFLFWILTGPFYARVQCQHPVVYRMRLRMHVSVLVFLHPPLLSVHVSACLPIYLPPSTFICELLILLCFLAPFYYTCMGKRSTHFSPVCSPLLPTVGRATHVLPAVSSLASTGPDHPHTLPRPTTNCKRLGRSSRGQKIACVSPGCTATTATKPPHCNSTQSSKAKQTTVAVAAGKADKQPPNMHTSALRSFTSHHSMHEFNYSSIHW